MASNQPSVAIEAAPLSFMQRLSSVVFLHDPPRPSASSRDPRLIVLVTWMAARDAHIAKYVSQHIALFPSSRILVIKCPVEHVLYTPARRTPLSAALPFLRDAARDQASGGGDTGVLIHVFSNGGVSTTVELMNMLASSNNTANDRDGAAGKSLPKHTMILDSCPGYFHWQSTHLALSQVLPFWASPLVHVCLAVNWLIFCPWGYPPPPDANASAINGSDLLGLQTQRAYVYGDADDMVAWQDVEDHAGKAERAGLRVRKEKFQGGRHCAHVRVDSDRYWRVVREVWDNQ